MSGIVLELNLFKTLYENSNDALYLIEPSNLKIISANTIGWESLGYSQEEILNLTVMDLQNREISKSEWCKNIEKIKKDGFLLFETNCFKKDGNSFPVEVKIKFIEYKDSGFLFAVARDISRRRKAENSLKESQNIFGAMIKSMKEGIILLDKNGLIISSNSSFAEMVGLRVEDIEGRTPLDSRWRIIHEDGTPYLGHTLPAWLTLKTKKSIRNDIHGIYTQDNALKWLLINSEPIIDESGELNGVVVTATDITELKNNEKRLKHLANYDSLTSLPNRNLFNEIATQVINKSKNDAEMLAILFFDLDNFKIINDTLGHTVGDLLLKALSSRLIECIEDKGFVARLGGDEFVMILENIGHHEDDAISFAERLMHSLAIPFLIETHEIFVSGSLGISIYPQDGKNLEELMKCADSAMYRAKGDGKNQYQFYTQEMNTKAFERLMLENALRHAIKKDEFILFYQPQIDIQKNKIVGVEALLRWQHSELGLIPPIKFISIAEESGLIVQIGEWVLKEGIRQIKEWHKMGFTDIKISINLSARQFVEQNLIDILNNSLNQHKFDPTYLELEITESMFMKNIDDTLKLLKEFQRLGIKIAIDDFGTGYSSLQYLKKFPIDTLKIDKSFVRDIATDQDDRAIVKAIISLGKTLNLNIIAEGVEDFEQLEFLKKEGCDEVQGYIFSKPLSSNRMYEFLMNFKMNR